MLRRWLLGLLAGGLGVALWAGSAAPAQAQQTGLNRLYYYPYYYYPHNYWPSMGPKWPEPVGAPYQQQRAIAGEAPKKTRNWRKSTSGAASMAAAKR